MKFDVKQFQKFIKNKSAMTLIFPQKCNKVRYQQVMGIKLAICLISQ